jgi:hypothetical protein
MILIPGFDREKCSECGWVATKHLIPSLEQQIDTEARKKDPDFKLISTIRKEIKQSENHQKNCY